MTEEECRARLKDMVDAAGGPRAFAAEYHISPSYVAMLLTGWRNLSVRILEIIGVERVVTVVYREKGKRS